MPIPWKLAWEQALYGPGGFYRQEPGPAGHFTTATHGATGRVLAEALLEYAVRLGASVVVDVGAGRGELLAAMLDAPSRRSRSGDAGSMAFVGVDVVERPPGLDGSIEWLVVPGGPALPDELDRLEDVLVVAHEWLDVVPCTLAEVDEGGRARELLVDPATGVTSFGAELDDVDRQWCQQFWPDPRPGERVEVGLSRDLAWADLLGRIRRGTAVAIDYGHRVDDRPREGSFTAYRQGVQVVPVPDGSCDLTAHVAVDSLRSNEIRSQREALRQLGVTGRTPDHSEASSAPPGYLRALARASAESTLIAPGGFGDFAWVVAWV